MNKPGVSRSVHLFAAPFLWTAVGSFLMVRGWGWIGPGNGRFLLLIAALLGTAKAFFILDHVARRILQRIILFQDNTCLGAVYSWKTWIVVIVMIVTGVVIRALVQPGPFIGTVYCAVGWSLCLSSRLGWQQWYSEVYT
ncbi:MAG: hypothetical protein GXY53_04150 [Desulfobulbus sp.]|nr:hypothetical protein [Desulfobulbus sp.]